MRWLVCLGLLGLVSGACASSNGGGASTPVSASPVPSPSVAAAQASVSVSPSAESSPGAQVAIDKARALASSQLNVPVADLRLERVEARQWPDSSLGCPRPGDVYAQIVTPGFLVVLSGAGQQLEYHADTRGHVVLCSP